MLIVRPRMAVVRTGGTPGVAHRGGPRGRVVDTPLAHREEDRAAGGVERVAHDGVARLGRRSGVAVVVLEVVHGPGGVGAGVDRLLNAKHG